MADSDKNGIDIQRLFLAADLIADAQRLQPFRAIDCCYFTVKNENNVIMLLQLFQQPFFAAESIAAMDEINLFTGKAQYQRIIERCITAADDGHVFIFKKGSVTGSAVGNAGTNKTVFIFQSQRTHPRTGRQNHCFCKQFAAIFSLYAFMAAVILQSGHFIVNDFRTHFDSLIIKCFGKFKAGNGFKAGEILYMRSIDDLPALQILLDQFNRFTSTSGIDCRRQTRSTCADDQNISHNLFFSHSFTASQPQFISALPK